MSELRDFWEREGYIAVSDVFDKARTENLLRICDDVLAQFLDCCPERKKPGGVDDRNMRNLHRRSYFKDKPDDFVFMMEAFADPALSDIVEEILGKKIILRGTTYWFTPTNMNIAGNWHRDIQFLGKDPEEQKVYVESQEAQSGAQLMLALTPTDCSQYLPGSHLRWDTDEELHMRLGDDCIHATQDLEGAVRVKQEPGDVTILNATGLHRGDYFNDVLRRTVMITYTTEEEPIDDYFSLAPWCLEPGYLDGMNDYTKAFYQRYIDQYTDFWNSKTRKNGWDT
ncbi:MAG: phytanoyl-CoA dioxygenase family protein [Lentisphaeria bacterium]|nr:phytanoyl-CoA dioxygenase family protein [Lentisphaeria bacterium]NQZ67603.1 phytanoyl-CoA dioxygenase family protein [Lentisphaeria bacterium]